MIELSPAICLKIKEARRAAGLSQSVLANEVGCKQSALSMFEQGDGTKLNDAVVEKLAAKFNIDLHPTTTNEISTFDKISIAVEKFAGFCPNPNCPSNRRYEVDGRTFALPDRHQSDPVGGKFCALCGEILEKRCPNCGAPIHEGAVCSHCGEPYIVIV